MNFQDASNAKSTNPVLKLKRSNSQLFINRELSWIEFNHRVLEQARRESTPLLEKVKFLSILSANVDEFYMKRMGSLKQKIAAGNQKLACDGLTAGEQLDQCRASLRVLQAEKEKTYRQVSAQLQSHDIVICPYASLEQDEQTTLGEYYAEMVEPLVTPCVVNLAHPFPFTNNLSLYLIVSMKRQGVDGVHLLLIKVPTDKGLPRLIKTGIGNRFVKLEELIAGHVGQLFPQEEIVSVDEFRVTRNAVSHRDYSELDDQREMIEEELHDRKFASVVRLQVNPSMSAPLRRALAVSLGLDHEGDIFESREMLRMSDLKELASLDIPQLHDEPHYPVIPDALLNQPSILAVIRAEGSVVLQHPYESFTHSVERFVLEASRDPDVLSIKMTLYRTSEDTRIIDYLTAAAANGKRVSVVVELKARFDEASNLLWARRLENAGVQVHHSVSNLKTHCKCILVVRKDQDKLRRYAHIGTGNYHAGTAQLYSDFGLLTCDDSLTEDISTLFKYMTSDNRSERQFNQIMATPQAIKTALLGKIAREISLHSEHSPGYICLKTNAVEDPDITLALYQAAQAGVRIDLIVRDICRLRPGIVGVSDKIRVISIVGRFLEHSRLYRFRNGGDEELFMGSADLMTRNLERRVELLVPVKDPASRQLLCEVLNQQLRDNQCAWDMQADGSYRKLKHSSESARINSQVPVAISEGEQPGNIRFQTLKTAPSKDSRRMMSVIHRIF